MRAVYNLGIILCAFTAGWLLIVLIPNLAIAAVAAYVVAGAILYTFWRYP